MIYLYGQSMYNEKEICWSEEKNMLLMADLGRHVSFDAIEQLIEKNDVLADLPHYNQQQYPHQRVIFVAIDDYVYMVPYIDNDDHIFLKTAYPSRKATKHFLS